MAIIKKILKKIFPQRLVRLIRNLEKLDKLDSIPAIKMDALRSRINTEIIFEYIVGFKGRVAEREILNTYEQAPPDHLIRYKLFSDAIKKGDSVLDAACGCGYGSAYLNDFTEAASIVGGDINPHVVAFAQKIFGEPTYVWKPSVVSFCTLDIADSQAFLENSFDKICSFETLEHVPPAVAAKAFENLYRWLKPKGVLHCSVPNNDIHPFERYKGSPYHFRHYTPQEFKDALHGVGFSKVSLCYYNAQGEIKEEATPDCFGTILAFCEK